MVKKLDVIKIYEIAESGNTAFFSAARYTAHSRIPASYLLVKII